MGKDGPWRERGRVEKNKTASLRQPTDFQDDSRRAEGKTKKFMEEMKARALLK